MSLGILRLFKLSLVLLLSSSIYANTQDFDFNLIKKGNQDNNTLLLIGGIQGDEPGGFMAASLIATHYTIKKGSVWVIPNLNFYSIIERSRGPYGDMNRKFAKLSKKDPDYGAVQRIKDYIKKDDVKLILNLHDGSGFYREKHVDNTFSPKKWGQIAIIDQENLNVQKYGNLNDIASKVCKEINSNLIRPRDRYRVRNTNTKAGDKEMEKTLTYFAINNGKAAFANEASKVLPLHERTYYHLIAVENYMKTMGIEFERNFQLTPKKLKSVIDDDIYISFYDDKIKLPLSKIRNYLNYIPVRKDGTIDFSSSSPLMVVIKKGNVYNIHYGNRRLARFTPDYFDIYENIQKVDINIDGKEQEVKMGSIIYAKKDFIVKPQDDIRVNVIGYTHASKRNESGLKVSKDKILKRYSIDKQGKIYRIEFYKKDKFAGMVIVKFGTKRKSTLSVASNGYTGFIKEL